MIYFREVIIQNLCDEYSRLKNVVLKMSSKMVDLETKCNLLEQCSRKNNLRISGIPDSVERVNLEGKIIEILNVIQVDVSKDVIEACHRTGKPKNSSKTKIARLVNRKKCKSALLIGKRSPDLSRGQIYINVPSFLTISHDLSICTWKITQLFKQLF